MTLCGDEYDGAELAKMWELECPGEGNVVKNGTFNYMKVVTCTSSACETVSEGDVDEVKISLGVRNIVSLAVFLEVLSLAF
jgi:hypothetical protein